MLRNVCGFNLVSIFDPTLTDGDVAQSVEQRTENPCVGGSIPSITTKKGEANASLFLFSTFSPYYLK
jgi:hypothetical protein